MNNIKVIHIISALIALTMVFISAKIKRNSDNIYYADIRNSLVPFSVCFYFAILLFSSFATKQFRLSIFLTIFTLFFFIIGLFVIIEYCKINEKVLIINNAYQKLCKININEIEAIDFIGLPTNPNIDSYFNIITNNNEYIKMRSNIENIKGFVEIIKQINPNINIINNIPVNKNIINSILIFLFLFLSICELFAIVDHSHQIKV